jgi:hypothetical protein
MKKVVPLVFCTVVLCCIMALGLGSCRKADYSEILSENHSVSLRYAMIGQPAAIYAGEPARFAVDLSWNTDLDDVVAVYTSDEGEVVKSPRAGTADIIFKRPGTHILEVKIYVQGMRDRVLCQDKMKVEVK